MWKQAYKIFVDNLSSWLDKIKFVEEAVFIILLYADEVLYLSIQIDPL